MLVRRARPSDFDDLCPLMDEVDAFHRTHRPDLFAAAAGGRSRDGMDALLAEPDTAVFVADVGGRLAGFLLASLREPPANPLLVPRRFVHVETMGVSGAARRAGVGRALMTQVEAWAAERGASTVEFHVYAFNRGGVAFYEALGYQVQRYSMTKPVHAPGPGAVPARNGT